ncbi:hypothetical protein ACFL1Z_04405 [Thermodesulfobacteriota bacterium]
MSKKVIKTFSTEKKKESRLSRFLKWLEQGRVKAAAAGCKT